MSTIDYSYRRLVHAYHPGSKDGVYYCPKGNVFYDRTEHATNVKRPQTRYVDWRYLPSYTVPCGPREYRLSPVLETVRVSADADRLSHVRASFGAVLGRPPRVYRWRQRIGENLASHRLAMLREGQTQRLYTLAIEAAALCEQLCSVAPQIWHPLLWRVL